MEENTPYMEEEPIQTPCDPEPTLEKETERKDTPAERIPYTRDNAYLLADDPKLFFEKDTGRRDKDGNSIKSYVLDYEYLMNIISRIFHPVKFKGRVFTYNTETGIYDEGTDVITSWVQAALRSTRDEHPDKISKGAKLKPYLDELEVLVRGHRVIDGDDSPFNKFDGVPVKNGVLQFDSEGNASLIPYTPEQMFTWQLATNYNPDADSTQMFEIIDGWVDKEDRLLCIEPMAQAIIQCLPRMENIRKAWFFFGPPRGGKSTFINLLERVVGKSNTAAVGLQDLDKKFAPAALENKVFNIVEELPRVGMDDGHTFMSVVSTKHQQIERKFQEPYNTDIRCVHVFASNKPPALSPELQEEPAWWDRIRMHVFEREYEDNPNWKEENYTKENIEAYFHLAVIGAGEIIRNGGHLLTHQEPEEVAGSWMVKSDPISKFLEENFIVGNPEDWVLKDDVLNAIRNFHDRTVDKIERTLIPTEMNQLSIKLRTREITPCRIRNPDHSGERIQVYKGLKWNYSPMDRVENSSPGE